MPQPTSLNEQRSLARASPGGLALTTSPEFRLPPHLRKLDRHLVRFCGEVVRKSEIPIGELEEGESRQGPRLMVFMPPRHGKSLLTSNYMPAWALGSWPTMRIIVSSYQGTLPAKWGRFARDLLEEYGEPLFDVGVSSSSKASAEWETTMGGGLLASGIGGGITGRGGEILIIDDPVKDQEQALSSTYRDRVWNWWNSTAAPRLQPGAGVLLIMTRWHEDDLAGRFLKQDREGDGEGWEVINYPALAEPPGLAPVAATELDEEDLIGDEDEEGPEEESAPEPPSFEGGPVDDLGRQMGEALWPEMYDADHLGKLRRRRGTYWFTALYQQRPGPSEGSIIKRAWVEANFYEPYQPPQIDEVAQTWDLRFGDGTQGSYVVGQAWSSDQADRYLLGQIRARLGFTDTLLAIEAMTKWVADRGWATRGQHRIYIERAANGPAAINSLKKKLPGIVAVEAKDTKTGRLNAVSPQFEGGNVHVPRGTIPCPPPLVGEDGEELWTATRTDDYVDELVNFPLSMNDDQVDATAQVLVKMGTGTRKARRIRSGGYDRDRVRR